LRAHVSLRRDESIVAARNAHQATGLTVGSQASKLPTLLGQHYGPAMRRSGTRPSGFFFALLALVAQLAFGAAVPNIERPLALHEAALICHARSADEGKTQPAQHHHVPVRAFCPLWTALSAQPLLLASAGPSLAVPLQTLLHRAGLPPPSTAPPSIPFRLAQPRAPPRLA
jgi:hypothetical protein